MSDKLIRATAANNTVSVVFCNMKETCNKAIELHHLQGVAAEVLSRALIASALISSTLKNNDDYVTMIIKSNGPAEGLTVTATQQGRIKGYLHNSDATAATISDLLGSGILTISKDIGMREPYIGQLPLVTGEIADDITAYFTESEQIQSSCGLGVNFNKDGKIENAGGFLIQLLPKAPYYVIDQLEIDLARHPNPVELLLKYGNEYEKILIAMLPALKVQILSETDIQWYCDCSKDKMSKALISIGKDQLEEIISDGEETEIVCDFCKNKYTFSVDEVKELKEKSEL